MRVAAIAWPCPTGCGTPEGKRGQSNFVPVSQARAILLKTNKERFSTQGAANMLRGLLP
jgi:hypothetical protein